MCFIFHKWSKWTDKGTIQIISAITNGLIKECITQEKRCLKCGKLKLRIEWESK